MKLGKSFKSILTVEFVDFVNSTCWFFMDVLWLFEAHNFAFISAIIAIVTSIIVLLTSQKKVEFFVNLSNTSWILVNASWFIGEVYEIDQAIIAAKSIFFVGAASLIGVLLTNKEITTDEIPKENEIVRKIKLFSIAKFFKRS